MIPNIDVVIVAYNRFDLTAKCLDCLGSQTVAHRLIIVDNGSTDDTSKLITEQWPHAQLMRLEHNSPFAVACNLGVKSGDGEVVVLINNDVECKPDFLEAAVAPFASDPQVGSVATLMLQPGEQLIDSFGMCADPTLAGYLRLHGHPSSDTQTHSPVLVGPPGTAAAYRRSAWTQVGGLDEHIFAYAEDFDLALRLRAAGWKAVAVTGAIGVHLGSATHGHRSNWQRYNGGFGRGYLMRRYGVLKSSHAVRALVTEVIVCAGDFVISRDLAALRGRLAGWRAGTDLPRLPMPPADAVDHEVLGFKRSLQMRRGTYSRARA